MSANCNKPLGKCFIAWTTSDTASVLIYFLAFTEDPTNLIAVNSALKQASGRSCFKENNKEAVKLISKILDKEDKTQVQLLIKEI